MSHKEFENKMTMYKKVIIDSYIKENGIKQKLTKKQKYEIDEQIEAYNDKLFRKTVLEPMTKIPDDLVSG